MSLGDLGFRSGFRVFLFDLGFSAHRKSWVTNEGVPADFAA